MSKKPADAIREEIVKQVGRIREALKDRNLRAVAEASGLHENTVYNLMNNKDGLATLSTIQKLSDYLFV